MIHWHKLEASISLVCPETGDPINDLFDDVPDDKLDDVRKAPAIFLADREGVFFPFTLISVRKSRMFRVRITLCLVRLADGKRERHLNRYYTGDIFAFNSDLPPRMEIGEYSLIQANT